jgi:hypothetical protein
MSESLTTDQCYRLGEWESIKALVSDRDEATVYLKVEAVVNELAATHAAIRALPRYFPRDDEYASCWLQNVETREDKWVPEGTVPVILWEDLSRLLGDKEQPK